MDTTEWSTSGEDSNEWRYVQRELYMATGESKLGWAAKGAVDVSVDSISVLGRRCAQKACPPNMVKCPNGGCILQSWVCDRQADCSDGWDEHPDRCPACMAGKRACSDGPCVPEGWFCDWDTECMDGSDEKNCPCGARLNSPRGSLRTHPSPYENDSNCTWTITAPVDHVIQLKFSEFDLEEQATCSYDRVSIYDGTSPGSSQLGTYCGPGLPPVISSTSRTMRVTFTADYTGTRKGFAATYTSHVSVPQCGRSKYLPNPIVYGGRPARENEFPFQVTLRRDGDGFNHICGGVIIREDLVLTAAHCIRRDKDDPFLLVVGDHRLSDDSNTTLAINIVSDTCIRKGFDRATLKRDLAVIRVHNPIAFNADVQPICLPGSAASHNYTGTDALITGWGVSPQGRLTDVLQQAKVQIVAREKCEAVLGASSERPGELCVQGQGTNNSIGPCHGDSGGPLFFREQDRWQLIGIASYVIGGCFLGNPFAYTSVAHHLDWINDVLAGNWDCEP